MAKLQSPATKSLSTAEQRRPAVLEAAVRAFAQTGYRGTTVAEVAAEAGISPAYVFRLFEDKQTLFIAALNHCLEQIQEVLEKGAAEATLNSPEAVLGAMGLAYARLIADRKLLMMQIHALAASSEPAIQKTLQGGYQTLTEFVSERSQADPRAVQHLFAYGQLCHLVTAVGLIDDETVGAQAWAQTLVGDLKHFPSESPT